jgi:hypothetical protein
LINDIFGSLTPAERRQLIELCRKIRDASIIRIGKDVGEVENILLTFSGVREPE